jgi:hypothetical protein
VDLQDLELVAFGAECDAVFLAVATPEPEHNLLMTNERPLLLVGLDEEAAVEIRVAGVRFVAGVDRRRGRRARADERDRSDDAGSHGAIFARSRPPAASNRRTPGRCLSLVVLAAASACITGPPRMPRGDVAIIEAGDATIARIDDLPIQVGNNGEFEVRPGVHTVEINGARMKFDNSIVRHYLPIVGSLCLKAKPGRRYRINAAVINGRKRILFIDTATGEPPKTPCGPDEDED